MKPFPALRRCLSLRLLALLLVSGSVHLAQAQIGERRSQLSIGGSGGLAFSSVDFDPTIKQGQLSAPMMGFVMRYTCEKYFTTVCALQAEVNYVGLGWKEDILSSRSLPLEDTFERTLGYVQVPLLARLGWGRETRGLQFFIVAGPQFGYLLKDDAKRGAVWTLNDEGHPDRPNNVYQQYEMEPDRKFDYGLTGGLGLELSTAIGHFMLEGRYYYGLNDVYNNSKKDVFARSAHRSMMVKLSYLVDIIRTK
ncbi:MAG: PorT family protein [Bacteroidaceae bacterium]|nr:PorT family protein [Bacteroidaceae bacterium]